uniref:Uncharacterized protein n=1 Tax=Rhizophora mucronata TaxID=61149 RepID=A0A2P2IYZ1_RHIMU
MRIWFALRFASFIFWVLILAMASVGRCSRPMKGASFDYLLENRLPRGPVPPSGPSHCHNKLGPYKHSQLSYVNDYAVCP